MDSKRIDKVTTAWGALGTLGMLAASAVQTPVLLLDSGIAHGLVIVSSGYFTHELLAIKPDGTVETRQEDMTNHRRLQIDTRKWLLSRWLPAAAQQLLVPLLAKCLGRVFASH